MKNRYLIFKFNCHKCLFFITLPVLQRIEQFEMQNDFSLNNAHSGEIIVKDFYCCFLFFPQKAFLQFQYCHKKSLPFSPASFFFFLIFFFLSWCPGIHFKGSGFRKNNKEPETGKYTQVWQTHLHEQDRLFSSRHPK